MFIVLNTKTHTRKRKIIDGPVTQTYHSYHVCAIWNQLPDIGSSRGSENGSLLRTVRPHILSGQIEIGTLGIKKSLPNKYNGGPRTHAGKTGTVREEENELLHYNLLSRTDKKH